jgi:hypothetical protein
MLQVRLSILHQYQSNTYNYNCGDYSKVFVWLSVSNDNYHYSLKAKQIPLNGHHTVLHSMQ